MNIRMLKICGDSIIKPSGLILGACLEQEGFPQNWKKANVAPIHKKQRVINKELTIDYNSFTYSNVWENLWKVAV